MHISVHHSNRQTRSSLFAAINMALSSFISMLQAPERAIQGKVGHYGHQN